MNKELSILAEEFKKIKENIGILTSCLESQKSFEDNSKQHGIFTGTFIEILNKEWKKIRLEDLYEEIKEKFDCLKIKEGVSQDPQKIIEGDIYFELKNNSKVIFKLMRKKVSNNKKNKEISESLGSQEKLKREIRDLRLKIIKKEDLKWQ